MGLKKDDERLLKELDALLRKIVEENIDERMQQRLTEMVSKKMISDEKISKKS